MKKSWMLKVFATGMTAVLMTTSFGCGKQEEEKGTGQEKTEESVQKETDGEFQTTYGDKQFDNVTITVEVFDRSSAPEGSTVTKNKWVDYINREMNQVGITVEFVAVPRSEEVTKIQTMMGSGTAPDIIMTYDRALSEDYFKQEGIYNLGDYIDGEHQARNLKAYVGNDVLDIGRTENGELFSIPARHSTTARGNLCLRKDWLDALNMDVPSTADELYEVLKAFKNRNPEGRTDIIAYDSPSLNNRVQNTISISFLKSAADEKSWNIDATVYTDDGYAEYLRFLNKLYQEELLDPEFYATSNADQSLKEHVVSGRTGVFDCNANAYVDSLWGGLLQNLKQDNPNADIVSIPPLKNIYDGNQYNVGYAKNGAFLMIPKTAKNVEACVTYLDWLATKEGGFALFHGFEGEHYIDENGVPVVKDADYNAKDKDWIRHDLFLVGNQGYYATEEDFIQSAAKEIPGYEDKVIDNFRNAIAGTVRYESYFVAPAFVENSVEIGLANEEYWVKAITCNPAEFDSIIEDWRAALQELGYDKVIAERTEFFNKVMED